VIEVSFKQLNSYNSLLYNYYY